MVGFIRAFDRFHFTLLNARHRQRRNIAEKDSLLEIAGSTNLDTAQFEKDLSDRSLLKRLAEDHMFAVGILGIPAQTGPANYRSAECLDPANHWIGDRQLYCLGIDPVPAAVAPEGRPLCTAHWPHGDRGVSVLFDCPEEG